MRSDYSTLGCIRRWDINTTPHQKKELANEKSQGEDLDGADKNLLAIIKELESAIRN